MFIAKAVDEFAVVAGFEAVVARGYGALVDLVAASRLLDLQQDKCID